MAVQLRVAEQRGTAAFPAYLSRLALGVEESLAHPAVSAGDLEGHHNSIAGTNLADLATDLEDDPDRLMAEYVPRTHEGAHGLVQVKIGPADIAAGDLDDRVVRFLDDRVGNLFHRDVAEALPGNGLHCASHLAPLVAGQMRAGLHAAVDYP